MVGADARHDWTVVDSVLLFFAAAGASVTLFTGLFSLLVFATAFLREDSRWLDQLGFAVDSGVAFGFLFGVPAGILAATS